MKMTEMLLALNKIGKDGKHTCQSCLINYINTVYSPSWNISLPTIRRRIKYLEKSNLGTWNKSHVCSFCGRRKANVVELYPNVNFFISTCIEAHEKNNEVPLIDVINLIGQPSLLSYYFRFAFKMADQKIDYILTSRMVSQELKMNYNIMLINLNRLAGLFLFIKQRDSSSALTKYLASDITLKYVDYVRKNLKRSI